MSWQEKFTGTISAIGAVGFILLFFMICSGAFKPAPTPAEVARNAKIAELDERYQKALDQYDDAEHTPENVRNPEVEEPDRDYP